MIIDLPPNFDMDNPHKELVYCPSCNKYQHFSFNRPRMIMWCGGCRSKYGFSYMGLKPREEPTTKIKPSELSTNKKIKPYELSSMEYPHKRREKYGPPRYLMVYNHWKEHPEFTTATLWRFFYWDVCSYNTVQRYIRCIKKDLEGLEKV